MTDTQKAAMEQALEALEQLQGGCTDHNVTWYKLVPEVPTNEWINNLARRRTGSFEDAPFAEIHQCIAELLESAPEAPQPAKSAEQEPVAAQHRFRHPQKGTPDWSVWQPCKVAQRPAWEVDSQGYEVEYRALYTEPQPKREPVEATPYNLKRIAWELERTALGDGFYGNALRVAKDIPDITPEDRSVLDRYATGTHSGTDHVHLQWLALRLYNEDERKPLTDEFLRKLHHIDEFGLFCDYDDFEQIARAIEAAHGIGEHE